MSCKDGHNRGHKWYGPNRSRRYQEEVARIHRRNIQKHLYDPDNHNGVITHLEPDLLEVKWTLQSTTMNRASGGDGNPVQLFQIWKTQQWPQDWKRSVFTPIPKKGNAKECSNHHIIALILHANKIMLKILQARLQQYVNHELPDVQTGFKKGRGTRDQIANIH